MIGPSSFSMARKRCQILITAVPEQTRTRETSASPVSFVCARMAGPSQPPRPRSPTIACDRNREWFSLRKSELRGSQMLFQTIFVSPHGVIKTSAVVCSLCRTFAPFKYHALFKKRSPGECPVLRTGRIGAGERWKFYLRKTFLDRQRLFSKSMSGVRRR